MQHNTLTEYIMRPSDTLALNLKTFFEANELTTNGVATKTGVSQKTIWVCVNGTVAPSVNVAQVVAAAAKLDAFTLMRQEYTARQIKNSKRVGELTDKLMLLSIEQIRMIDEMVGGLLKA